MDPPPKFTLAPLPSVPVAVDIMIDARSFDNCEGTSAMPKGSDGRGRGRGSGRRDRSLDAPTGADGAAVGGAAHVAASPPVPALPAVVPPGADAQVNFTIQVPFDIVEGMRCRALFYGDETYNDATVVRRSKTGWHVSFVGYESDPLQDTHPADILAMPNEGARADGGQTPRRRSAAGRATAGRVHGRAPTARTDIGATSTPDGGPLLAGMRCRACFYDEGVFYSGILVKPSRKGWLVTFDGYPDDKPQDTNSSDIVFPAWVECCAPYYGDGGTIVHAAFQGPKTSKGFLVGFAGYERDPCQDTRGNDIGPAAGGWGKKPRKGAQGKGEREGSAGDRDAKQEAIPEGGVAVKPVADGLKGKRKGAAEKVVAEKEVGSKGGAQKKGDGGAEALAQEATQKGGGMEGATDQGPPRSTGRSGQNPASGEAAEEAAGERGAGKDRAPDECVVHVRNVDPQVDKMALKTFCTKTVGMSPLGVKMLQVSRSLACTFSTPSCLPPCILRVLSLRAESLQTRVRMRMWSSCSCSGYCMRLRNSTKWTAIFACNKEPTAGETARGRGDRRQAPEGEHSSCRHFRKRRGC